MGDQNSLVFLGNDFAKSKKSKMNLINDFNENLFPSIGPVDVVVGPSRNVRTSLAYRGHNDKIPKQTMRKRCEHKQPHRDDDAGKGRTLHISWYSNKRAEVRESCIKLRARDSDVESIYAYWRYSLCLSPASLQAKWTLRPRGFQHVAESASSSCSRSIDVDIRHDIQQQL